MSSALNPGRSVSTRNPRTLSPSSSTFAQITATSAMVPDVIHIFSPFNTYSFPTLRARVLMPPGFDPKSGSVNPKQPSFSPFCIAGSQVFFCSSVPKVYIGYITSADCTLTNERTPESPRSSSCVTSPYSTFDMPAHPYPFNDAPKNPRSAIGFTSSRGNRSARLHSSMIGTRLSSINLRAVSRTRRSSSSSNVSKSMKSTPRNLMAGITSHPTKSANSERETSHFRHRQLPESRPVLFQNTPVHHHKHSGLSRLLRRAFVDHAFLQPDRRNLQPDRLLHDLIHKLWPPE